jgi:hypothetical protein
MTSVQPDTNTPGQQTILGTVQADHALRVLLFGTGDTTSGYVRGEDARLRVAAELNALMDERRALVARCEEAEKERDESDAELRSESRMLLLARAERAERLLREKQDALALLWTYYLLPITDEQKAQVVQALAASGPDPEATDV